MSTESTTKRAFQAVTYIVTWKNQFFGTRETEFRTLDSAERHFKEMDLEGKLPLLYEKKVTITPIELRPN